MFLVPDTCCYKIPSTKNFIHDNFHIMRFAIVNRHPYCSVLHHQIAQEFKARPHHSQPLSVLQIVVVMREGGARVVGWIDVDTLHPPGVEGQQGLERLQVVVLNEHVPGIGVSGGEIGNFLQQAIGHLLLGANVLVSRQPVQCGHQLSLTPMVFPTNFSYSAIHSSASSFV